MRRSYCRRAIALLLLTANFAFISYAADSNSEPSAASENLTNTLGSWIWADKRFNGQTCQFWRTFDVPHSMPIRKARLRMTSDDFYVLFLDGREIGRGAEWRELYDYDLTPLMSPGRHILAVNAMNSFSFAGMLLGLHIELADGRVIEIKSDESWRLVPPGTRGWEKTTKAADGWPGATIVAKFGSDPWWSTPVRVNEMPTLQPIKVFFWQTGWFQITLLSVCGIVITFSFWLMAQLTLHKKERLLLQRERSRIARDIHDDLGARMTQLVLHGEVVQSELPHDSNLRPQLNLVCQEAREMLSTLDEILWAVNPSRDTLSDFSSYVCSYTEEFLKPTGIQGLFDVDSEMEAVVLDLPLRRTLLMAIKETLNNAVKYSGATELLVQIKCRGRKLTVVVQDNGKGFAPLAAGPGRNGLSNMSERMVEVGGNCVVASKPGNGCRVEFALALKPARQRPFARIWKRKQITTISAQTNSQPLGNEGSPTNEPVTH
jgi:signal transduction histidine kinase